MLPRHIEGRLDAVLLEDIEDGGCVLVVRTVIERQVDDFPFFVGRKIRHNRRQPFRAALRDRVLVVNRDFRVCQLKVGEVIIDKYAIALCFRWRFRRAGRRRRLRTFLPLLTAA